VCEWYVYHFCDGVYRFNMSVRLRCVSGVFEWCVCEWCVCGVCVRMCVL
jgi:hypothetical protein